MGCRRCLRMADFQSRYCAAAKLCCPSTSQLKQRIQGGGGKSLVDSEALHGDILLETYC